MLEVPASSELPPLLPRISDYVAWHARERPDAEAMVIGETRFCYAQFADQVDKLAKALLAAGVEKGDRVATLSTPSPDYFVAFLAASSIGAIWIGLNPRYQLDELAYVTRDSEPKVLLARTRIEERKYTAELTALRKRTPSISSLVIFDPDDGEPVEGAVGYDAFLATAADVSNDALEAARHECGGRDPCMIVYTSGSTGQPKGALLHHEGIVAFSLEQNRLWPIAPMRALNYFPINHIGCVVDLSTPTLVAGGAIIFLEQFTPRASLSLMETERITLWGSVPSTFQLQFNEQDFDRVDLSAVQMIMWGGASMPREMIDRLLGYGVPLATNYGLTESGSAITAIPPMRDPEILEKTVGWPFPGVEIRLVGADGQEVEDGEAGEILARSKYNMLGYWRRSEATAETLLDGGWLATGDLGQRNPDGSYSIVGRIKEMYKSGGYNVYPREIEATIESHPAVDIAAVVSTDDKVWQEIGVAYVTANAELTVEALEEFCRARLANYKLPKRFILVDQLPLLPIGKIDKVALRERAREDYRSGEALG